MMTLTPRLLVAMVLLWVVTVVVQSRPTSVSEEPEIEESIEMPSDPSVVLIPIRQLTDPDSALARILRDQLNNMSEQNLLAMEKGLAETKTEPDSIDNQDMMMGDMPSADEPQDSSSPATTFGRATVMPDDYTDEMSHRESLSNNTVGRLIQLIFNTK